MEKNWSTILIDKKGVYKFVEDKFDKNIDSIFKSYESLTDCFDKKIDTDKFFYSIRFNLYKITSEINKKYFYRFSYNFDKSKIMVINEDDTWEDRNLNIIESEYFNTQTIEDLFIELFYCKRKIDKVSVVAKKGDKKVPIEKITYVKIPCVIDELITELTKIKKLYKSDCYYMFKDRVIKKIGDTIIGRIRFMNTNKEKERRSSYSLNYLMNNNDDDKEMEIHDTLKDEIFNTIRNKADYNLLIKYFNESEKEVFITTLLYIYNKNKTPSCQNIADILNTNKMKISRINKKIKMKILEYKFDNILRID